MAKTYNIFISHSWAYSDAYDKLISLFHKKPYFYFKNYSVPKNDPVHNASNQQELYDAIKKQVSYCNIVLIMAGVYSTYSKWINKEIRIAKNEFYLSKPVIGIKPWANTNVSQVVAESCIELVSWNTDSIVTAIRNYAL